MKKTMILTAALLGGIALPTLTMADSLPVFPGAEATGCDPAQFTPIFGKNGDVLYWNNPTCPNGQGGMDADHPAFAKPIVVDETDEDEEVAEDPVEEPVIDAEKV